MMTKKHFQLLADALKAEQPGTGWDPNKRVQWLLDVKAIALVCLQNNPRFRTVQFLTACGVTDPS